MRNGLSLAALTTFLCLLAAGCGGGGGGTRAKVTLQWPQRSRGTLAPGSALSARVRIVPQSGTPQEILVDRHADPAPYADPREGNSITPGGATLTVTFYALPGQTGEVVAVGTSPVTVANDGTVPDIGVGGKVVFLDIPANQQVLAGASKDLTFSARDNVGTVLALTPGSCFWTVVANADRLRFDAAAAVGLLPGTATIRATVDGITSANASVKVTSNAVVTIQTPNPSVAASSTFTFTASVTGTGTGSTAVTWSVTESGGGTIGVNSGVYTAPNAPGTYHVTATSVFDPEKSATTTVVVTGGGVDVEID